MKVSTGGEGGHKIHESVRIKTNDPSRPWVQVAVTGMVEKFAEIRPERVRLAGPAGQPLSAEVVIIPRKDLPFTIQQIRPRDGRFIKYALVDDGSDGQGRYVVRVENTRTPKGRYVDVLYISTGSDLRPTIPIFITGIIQ